MYLPGVPVRPSIPLAITRITRPIPTITIRIIIPMLFITTATIITPIPDLMDIRESFTAGANSEATRAVGPAGVEDLAGVGDMSAVLVGVARLGLEGAVLAAVVQVLVPVAGEVVEEEAPTELKTSGSSGALPYR